MRLKMETSNPFLAKDDLFQQTYGGIAARSTTVTVSGVVQKTSMLVLLAAIVGAAGYYVVDTLQAMQWVWISAIASMIICFGVAMVVYGRPSLAKPLAPVYAAVQGAFLGAFSALLDNLLARADLAVTGGVAVQAFIITISVMAAMLLLYVTRIIRPNRTFTAVIGVLTAGIMFTYLLSWPIGLLLGRDLPFIGLGSAFGSGYAPLIGIGINVLILGVASFWLVIDFKMIEERVNSGAPKEQEWLCAFALLVSLAWIYYEAVKLVFRLAILFGGRD